MKRGLLLVTLFTMFSYILSMSIEHNRKKCRALVLEGGGDKGSYQVGVLKSFVENLPKVDVMYDVVTGVSVGSINAAGLALHKIGDEKEAINWMYGLWHTLGVTDIYINWPLGIFQGLFFEEGLWNNQPEREFLKDVYDNFKEKTVYRKININTVDYNTGEIYRYNETTEFEKLPLAVVASTSMPLAFPHVHMDNHTFIDGGSVWNLDLSGAIER